MTPMPESALDRLTIIEYNRTGGAAYATKLMADLGAEVIKVEPLTGDPDRCLGPFPGGEPHPEKSGTFLYLNCNKQSVMLDITNHTGRQVLDSLLRDADVFIHDIPPAEAEALGLSDKQVRAGKDRLVTTFISPFGESGPHRDWKAYDLTTLSAGGWTWLNGWPGHPEMPPLRPFGRQSAYQAGVNAALATMGALLARLRTGRGQHVEVSAQECITAILEMTFAFWPYMNAPTARWGQRPIHPIDFFQCKDGGWIFVLCVEEHQWQRLVELMETPEWTQWEVAANRFVRASNWDALRPFMEEWVSQWTTDDLYKAAQAKRIPFAPASTLSQLLDSEHLKARGFFVEIAYPQAGTIKQPGAPFKMSETPWEIRTPAPTLGQHNETILGERLGLSGDEIKSLNGARVG
ncbi:MAG: CoA transferase [Chloroflexi bacterium]|nr:MAG: CoA transferase [Chloroflexota bacterium]